VTGSSGERADSTRLTTDVNVRERRINRLAYISHSADALSKPCLPRPFLLAENLPTDLSPLDSAHNWHGYMVPRAFMIAHCSAMVAQSTTGSTHLAVQRCSMETPSHHCMRGIPAERRLGSGVARLGSDGRLGDLSVKPDVPSRHQQHQVVDPFPTSGWHTTAIGNRGRNNKPCAEKV
jgi:hypothetical protein